MNTDNHRTTQQRGGLVHTRNGDGPTPHPDRSLTPRKPAAERRRANLAKRKALKRLIDDFPPQPAVDPALLYENTKRSFMIDFGLDEKQAAELATQAVEQSQSAAAHRIFLQNMLKESA